MGWEYRVFFKGNHEETREKISNILQLKDSNYLEQRTDSYLQLNVPEFGFKFRGTMKGQVGKLEYKIRKKGEAFGPEYWDKHHIGSVSTSPDKIGLLKKAVQSIAPSISMDDFALENDIICCEKNRINSIINSSSVNTELIENFIPFNSVCFEFAYFSLRRQSGENLGEYFSINAENAQPEVLSSFIDSIVKFIDLPNHRIMGYPEFIMDVCNGKF